MAWTKGQGVIEAGEAKVKVYSRELASYSNSDTFEITDEDLIGELADIGGFGATRETKERTGFHYDGSITEVLNAKPNDLSFSENLTEAGLELRRGQFDDRKLILNVVATKEGKVLYACTGKISEWGMELPLGDTCKLTYKMAIEVDKVPKANITVPTE